jgi:hypothetical protein
MLEKQFPNTSHSDDRRHGSHKSGESGKQNEARTAFRVIFNQSVVESHTRKGSTCGAKNALWVRWKTGLALHFIEMKADLLLSLAFVSCR